MCVLLLTSYSFSSAPPWVYHGGQSLPGVPALAWVADDPQSVQGCTCSGTGYFLPKVHLQPHINLHSPTVPPAVCRLRLAAAAVSRGTMRFSVWLKF